MSHRSSLPLLLSLSGLLIAGLAAPALAKEEPASAAKPAAKPEPREPARRTEKAVPQIETTAFGAWALRCRKVAPKAEKAGTSPERSCEISETLEAQDHSGPVAKLSIGRPGGKGSLHAIVILPNNVSFPSSVFIRADDKDIWGVRLDWVRCIPGGCFAETSLADATVAHWHGLDSTGAIVFTDSTGEQVTLSMSFRGFGPAIDALNKAQ
jgi:invasion protein IalB